MSENDIWGGKKLEKEVTIRNYKASKNKQSCKRDICGTSIESSTGPSDPFLISVFSSAGFCVLWFLRVLPPTLGEDSHLGCWPALKSHKELDALEGCVLRECPFSPITDWYSRMKALFLELGQKSTNLWSRTPLIKDKSPSIWLSCLVALLGAFSVPFYLCSVSQSCLICCNPHRL